VRDSQRSKVYAAEREAGGIETYANERTPVEFTLPTVRDLEIYVAMVMGRQRLSSRYGEIVSYHPVRVGDGRRRRSACAGMHQIDMPRGMRTKWVVLHELAHVICSRLEDRLPRDKRTAGHGWRFAEIYLYLVKTHLGQARHDALRAAFKTHRVRFREPVRRQMTPEQRAACAARLALARAAKAA
jgi:hypothetical protein